MVRAKLIRKIPSFRGYPFDSYEYECIDCGTHYTRKAYNSRINPYCGEWNMEIWKDIEGFEGKYQVSTWGRVRSCHHNKTKILATYKNERGYLKVSLFVGKKKTKKYRVNRLVALAFIPNPYDLPQVNHKDGNKENNSYTNLEWATNEINSKHYRLMKDGEIIL